MTPYTGGVPRALLWTLSLTLIIAAALVTLGRQLWSWVGQYRA